MNRRKPLSIFNYLFILLFVVGTIISALFSAFFIFNYIHSFSSEVRSDIANNISTSDTYFLYSYDLELKRLFNILSEAYIFDALLGSEKNEVVIYKPLCEQLLIRCTKSENSIYLSTRFIDNKGNEWLGSSGARRLRELYSYDEHPDTGFYNRLFRLYERLSNSLPGEILIDGPFTFDSKNTFLAGTVKSDPETGAFAGVFIAHCDLANFMNYISYYKVSTQFLGSVFGPDGQTLLDTGNKQMKYAYHASKELKIGAPKVTLCTVRFSVTWDPIRTYVIKAMAWSLLLFAFLLLVLTLISFGMSRSLTGFINNLAVVVHELARGNLSRRAEDMPRAPAEIQDLSSSMNKMADDLQKSTVSIDALIKEVNLREETEKALRHEKTKAQQYLELAPSIMLALDMEGRITMLNDIGCRILRCKHSEAVGKNWFETFIPEKAREDVKKVFTQLMKGSTKMLEYVENYVITGQGDERIVRWHNTALLDAANRPIGVLSSGEDVTEHKKAEEALKKSYADLKAAQEQLVQAEKMEIVGRMAAGVAHEVKNPLGIVLQGINYLESTPLKKYENSEQILGIMKNNIKRADYIVRALLDFSRASAMQMSAEDINTIIHESVKLGGMESEARSKNISVVNELAHDLPKAAVDRRRIEQVMVNLLTNSMQAIESSGNIYVRSYLSELKLQSDKIGNRATDYFKPGEKAIHIEVEDTGCGISPENMKRIFEPFFSTKDPSRGTGLGLPVTRSIVEMHRGIIEIQSEEGKGTKVTVVFRPIKEQ